MSEFSENIVEKAWERSGGVCECHYTAHGHQSQCGKTLLKAYRRDRYSFFGWEAHSKSGQYLNSPDDCEILCWEPCYVEILSKKHKIHI